MLTKGSTTPATASIDIKQHQQIQLAGQQPGQKRAAFIHKDKQTAQQDAKTTAAHKKV